MKTLKSILTISGIVLLIPCTLLSCKFGFQQKTKFDFETGTQEWISQNWQDFRGSTGVEQTEKYSKSGHYSLVLDCDSNKNSKGEAYADLRKEFNAPLNLEGKTIKCWVMIRSSDANGNPHRPDKVQLFVRSVKNGDTSNEQLLTEQGSWYYLSGGTGSWTEIKLTPGTEASNHFEQGFDPKEIVVIGIKVAAGTGSSSFIGSLYIDDIDW